MSEGWLLAGGTIREFVVGGIWKLLDFRWFGFLPVDGIFRSVPTFFPVASRLLSRLSHLILALSLRS